ncbi:MAG: DUF4177 domain-containing protein [Pseudomonadota bacterium]
MMYEYKVIPAPRRGKRSRGAKGPAGRFAYALEDAINQLAVDGWEFVRAETLGADEREGVMRRKIETFHGVLVFRRAVSAENPAQVATPTPNIPAPVVAAPSAPEPAASPEPSVQSDPEVKPTPPATDTEPKVKAASGSKVTKVKASDLEEDQTPASDDK